MTTPRLLAIHDMCSFGRCSLTAAIPTLSAMGIQVCPFPTAIFSNNMTYKNIDFVDFSAHMTKFMDIWQQNGYEYDAIYSGFLANASQIAIVEDAIKLDGKLNSYLLESIFFPNSPLHDGAVIIRDDRIVAAHAILPLAQIDASLPSMGTRHRAALGITEETDAVALVISEESGAISLACRGRIKRRIPPEKLPRFLLGLLLDKDADSPLSGSMNNGLPENDDVSLNKE